MGVEIEKVGDTTTVELTEAENELYDRQIRLWGLESQKRLRTAKVLISGLNGIGAEVTKNIILSGVNSVKLHDDKVVTEEDFCSQFLASRDSLGVNRATASIERARHLNPMVEISIDTEPLEKKNEVFFSQFDVVVIIGSPEAEIIRIDNICRKKNIKFFCGDVWGMFGYCCADLQKHSFLQDVVKHKIISEPNQKVKTEIVTTAVQQELEFPPLQEVFDFDYNLPEFQRSLKRKGPAFLVLRILQKFREVFKRDPSYQTREEDIIELTKIRDELSNENIVPLSCFSNVFSQISPTAAVVGGVLAQEVIKVISKKEAPLCNVFLFDPETCCGFIENISAELFKKQ
ncbi:SUMO-activating enzyme subunit 1 [Episyrphus balteatus]|uniref:SUMO-activating enzyme subunit 1 n=1 Tax=Episyrphus balteatus TaxID=286459 RepID=UPI002486ADCD|nr:SUMO-activating enzyme subunit 1 [Episyrphus balteatus]